jgi:hypothetical protein
MKTWAVNRGGTEIKVTNSFATARLLVNGKTQDIFWGALLPLWQRPTARLD